MQWFNHEWSIFLASSRYLVKTSHAVWNNLHQMYVVVNALLYYSKFTYDGWSSLSNVRYDTFANKVPWWEWPICPFSGQGPWRFRYDLFVLSVDKGLEDSDGHIMFIIVVIGSGRYNYIGSGRYNYMTPRGFDILTRNLILLAGQIIQKCVNNRIFFAA